MRRINLIILVVVTVCLLAAPLALGQAGNPPASTQESGKTSSHGTTAAKQSGKEDAGGIRKRIVDGKETIYVDGVEVVDKDKLATIKKAIQEMCEEYKEAKAILDSNPKLKKLSESTAHVCQLCRGMTIPN